MLLDDGGAELSSLATDATGKLDVLGHDSDALGVNSAQVGVFEEADEVSLRCLLQCHDSRALEAQVRLEVLGDLADEALEGKLADEEFRALLVATDLTKRHSSRAVTMGLLDTTGRRGGFASGFRSQLLTGGLPTGRLASGLLRACHDD